MSQVITFCIRTMRKVHEEIEKKKLHCTQNLTETRVKRLFLSLERMKNSIENTCNKEKKKKFNYLKFKSESQSHSQENIFIHIEKSCHIRLH